VKNKLQSRRERDGKELESRKRKGMRRRCRAKRESCCEEVAEQKEKRDEKELQRRKRKGMGGSCKAESE
jgi:hypothetical protein